MLFRGVATLDFHGTCRGLVDVLVAHGRIQEIRSNITAPADAEIISGARRVLVPGLVDTFSGLAVDSLPGFERGREEEASRDVWLRRSAAHLDEAATISSAFGAATEAIRNGTTCLFDLHESPGFIYGALGRIKDVAQTLGLRAVLGYGVREGEDAGSLDEQLDVSRQAAAYGGGETLRMAIATGPLTEVSDETLQKLAAIRGKHQTPFLSELGRTEDEASKLSSAFGKSGAERLLAHGLADDQTAVRVGAWLTAEDRDRLTGAGVTLVHTPRSDLIAGRPRTSAEVLGQGAALGTAELESHVLRELRMAIDLATGAGERVPTEDVLRFLTAGQDLASRIFGAPLGRVEEGAAADLVLLEYDPSFPVTPETIAHHVLRGIGSARVLATMVDGRFLVRDGEITTIDAAQLCGVLRGGAPEFHERLFSTPYPGLEEMLAAERAAAEREEAERAAAEAALQAEEEDDVEEDELEDEAADADGDEEASDDAPTEGEDQDDEEEDEDDESDDRDVEGVDFFDEDQDARASDADDEDGLVSASDDAHEDEDEEADNDGDADSDDDGDDDGDSDDDSDDDGDADDDDDEDDDDGEDDDSDDDDGDDEPPAKDGPFGAGIFD